MAKKRRRGASLDPDALHRLCLERGWEQADLAKKAGLPLTTIQRAFQGKNISILNLKAIGGALGLKKDDLSPILPKAQSGGIHASESAPDVRPQTDAEGEHRRTIVFENQLQIIREMVAAAYKARNAARAVRDSLIPDPSQVNEKACESLNECAHALHRLMFDARAICPPRIFALIHNIARDFRTSHDGFAIKKMTAKRNLSPDDLIALDKLYVLYDKLDAGYNELVAACHEFLGIK